MKKAVKDGIFCLFTASFYELDGSGNSCAFCPFLMSQILRFRARFFLRVGHEFFRRPGGEVADCGASDDVAGVVDAKVKPREGDERGEDERRNAEFLRHVMVEDESSGKGSRGMAGWERPVRRLMDERLQIRIRVKGAGPFENMLQDAVRQDEVHCQG